MPWSPEKLAKALSRLDRWRARPAVELYARGAVIGPWETAEACGLPRSASLEVIANVYVFNRWPDPEERPSGVEEALLDGFREYLGHPPR